MASEVATGSPARFGRMTSLGDPHSLGSCVGHIVRKHVELCARGFDRVFFSPPVASLPGFFFVDRVMSYSSEMEKGVVNQSLLKCIPSEVCRLKENESSFPLG